MDQKISTLDVLRATVDALGSVRARIEDEDTVAAPVRAARKNLMLVITAMEAADKVRKEDEEHGNDNA